MKDPQFESRVPTPAFWPPVDLSKASFVAPNATVLGDVTLAQGSSVWYSTVLRGDVVKISLGAYTNVQDGAVLHGDPGEPLILEDYVTVGHAAVIHSAHVERGCLVGIGSTILNNVRVGAGSIVGAGALVTKDIPPRSLVLGVPAKTIRPVSEEEAENLIEHARKYERLAQVHAGTGTDLGFTESH